MALHQDTLWEVRTGGNNENGGGFHNRVPGTSVDYTQQNAPQLDLTDLACAGAGNITITSVVGGFTAAMVGNIIRIHAGANFTVGFYEIVTVNSGNSVDLDRTPATGVGANGHGKVGGGQVNCSLVSGAALPGNTVYIENGNYAAHPATTFGGAYTTSLPLIIWGYNGARGTRPTGVNRPLIQMGASQFGIYHATKIRNISFEGSADGIVYNDSGTLLGQIFENCKFVNLAVAGNASCVKSSGGLNTGPLNFIDCEFSGTPGATSYGVQATGLSVGVNVLNCYFHNSSYGILHIAGVQSSINAFFSIFANILLNGISSNGLFRSVVQSCTFTTIGVNGFFNGGVGTTFVNNTFTNCVNAGINSQASIVMNNNFFGNGNNWIGGTLNPVDNNTFIAPQFVTPGSNYALQRTSGLIDKAFSMRLGV